MAIAEYPSGLPYPLREGYGLKHVSPLMRTEMQSGRARQRRRFTSVPTNVPVTWQCTNEQAQFFETWFQHTLLDGSEWFTCPLKTPMGLKHYEARFTGMYDGPDLIGVSDWLFTAELEIRERQTLPKGWHEFPDLILSQSIIDKAINREWPTP